LPTPGPHIGPFHYEQRNQLVTRSKADIRNSSKNERRLKVKKESDPLFHHFICILILLKTRWDEASMASFFFESFRLIGAENLVAMHGAADQESSPADQSEASGIRPLPISATRKNRLIQLRYQQPENLWTHNTSETCSSIVQSLAAGSTRPEEATRVAARGKLAKVTAPEQHLDPSTSQSPKPLESLAAPSSRVSPSIAAAP
jgi:hypothetical protein